MTNNDVLRRMRYIFDLNDTTMISIFAHTETEVTREQISAWLKKDDDTDFVSCRDVNLAAFLNGFIIAKRGKKDGPAAPIEKKLNNNIVLKKIKIALALESDAIMQMLAKVDLPVSKHELSAFFRKSGHKNYRECKDQFLRNFLQGLQMDYRPEEGTFSWNKEAKPAAPEKK